MRAVAIADGADVAKRGMLKSKEAYLVSKIMFRIVVAVEIQMLNVT